ALSAHAGARVIVSTTLNSPLEIFDADSLAELRPPVPSKGGGPVRLWVQRFDWKEYLFAANHGAALGSLGVFDLSGEKVAELPLSPFPARAGSVGVAAGELTVGPTRVPVVFVTNTQSAVTAVAGFGCSLPNGSVTAYDASALSTVGRLNEIGTVFLSGPVPYAVSVDPAGARAFASTNCGDRLNTLTVTRSESCGSGLALTKTATRSTGPNPDGTIWDAARGLNYTANIVAQSRSVPGGGPGGVAYGAATTRIFVVNQFPLGSPSLSVIQIAEPADGPPSGADIGEIPLTAAGAGAPLPAFIAFDVVVQAR